MLSVQDINVFYGDFHVLHGVSLEAEEGAFVGVVGANGHGKSTLLKAICGLLPVRLGTIRFRGEAVQGMSAPELVSRGIVHVAEARHLFPQMSVRENLMLGAYLPRGRAVLASNLERVYTLYPRLKEREAQLAGTLSGGEAQMLALARGLMSGADLLAIDEPSLGLAPGLTATMLETVRAINAQGTTVLLVEQSLALLGDHLDSLYEIEEGCIRPVSLHFQPELLPVSGPVT